MSREPNKPVLSNLKFLGYSVEEVSFIKNNNFNTSSVKLDFEISPEYEEIAENRVDVKLNVKIFKDALENNYPFSLNVSFLGNFEVDVANEEGQTLMKINSVSILFPYLRSFISTLTANSNIPTLVLPPVNVLKMIGNNKQ